MLTIENINKIVGKKIVNEWYIKSIHGATIVKDLKGTHTNAYKIVIQNKITNSEGKIYLDRDYKNKEIKHWYELSCTKGNIETNQLITKENIKDIKKLLQCIKEIALD